MMNSPNGYTRSERGVALVTVLAVLVLLVVLVVGLAQLASSERKSSALASTIMSNENLLQITTNLALTQFRTATSHTPGTTWSSQPGMIRVIDGDNQLLRAYKLYSSGNMVPGSAAQLETDLALDSDPPDWASRRAVWHDLNAPVTVPSSETGQPANIAFPIVDPGILGTVAGFSVNGSVAPRSEIPMPVQWLYVLANGDMVTPDASAGDGQIVTLPGAEKENPPVGRIAFWADDETCKVNINTAGYARNDDDYSTFWGTPVMRTDFEDLKLSINQPWTNEFQRYPGHPATTGLNVVFDTLNLSEEQVLSLTPYYRRGGTQGGTRWTTHSSNFVPTPAQITELLKDDRLFASVDELLLNPNRTMNPAGLAADDIQRRRFFLTALSRAPESNLFDMPRVTIWPVWSDLAKRTAIDSLIAFCSTIGAAGPGEQPFYFVRESNLSTNELQGIPQNLKVYNYLRSITAKPFPGFGNETFATKYVSGNTRLQILTSIFDTIRLANLRDKSGIEFTPNNSGYLAPTDGPDNTRGPGRASTLTEVALLFSRPPTLIVEDPGNPGHSAAGVPLAHYAKGTLFYKLAIPAAGTPMPGQNVRIEVSGMLSGFRVRASPPDPWQPMFNVDTFSNQQIDSGATDGFRRGFGDLAVWGINHQPSFPPTGGYLAGGVPLSNDLVLPYDGNADNTRAFEIQGGTLDINIFNPANSTTPFQTYRITFPDASALTPMPLTASNSRWLYAGSLGRFGHAGFTGRSFLARDTSLAMQSPTGDVRSEILRRDLIDDFVPHYRYGKVDILGSASANNLNMSRWASTGTANLTPGTHKTKLRASLVTGFDNYFFESFRLRMPETVSHIYPQSIQEAFPPGDFDNGYGHLNDGSYSSMPDGGPALVGFNPDANTPYFRNFNTANESLEGTLASPNRQIASPVLFGSIPAGEPWRTLLFHPERVWHRGTGNPAHPGASNPPDFLFLDLFHMPVAEPYAISEPFSTAGKINLNARLMPFGERNNGGIQRETALHGILRSIRLTAIPEAAMEKSTQSIINDQTRFPLSEGETLSAIRERFDEVGTSRVYRTAAEICDIDLVPTGFTRANLASFWSDKRTTGSNSREAPYGYLLPRLTTKSNTFTVHYTVQSLKRVPSTAEDQWDENRDKVLGEQRGSFTIERYINPADPEFNTNNFPQNDFAARAGDSNPPSLSDFYQYRVIANKQFRP